MNRKLIALLLLVAAGIAAWYFLVYKKADPAVAAQKEAERRQALQDAKTDSILQTLNLPIVGAPDAQTLQDVHNQQQSLADKVATAQKLVQQYRDSADCSLAAYFAAGNTYKVYYEGWRIACAQYQAAKAAGVDVNLFYTGDQRYLSQFSKP